MKLVVLLCSMYLLVQVTQCYRWVTVRSVNDYPTGMVTYHATDRKEGLQAVCHKNSDSMGSGRDRDRSCQKAWDSAEDWVQYSYDVLVADSGDKWEWKDTTSAQYIRSHGVLTRSGSNRYYVCAVTKWGPGKLVIYSNAIQCSIAYYDKEHRFNTGYQVLVDTQCGNP